MRISGLNVKNRARDKRIKFLGVTAVTISQNLSQFRSIRAAVEKLENFKRLRWQRIFNLHVIFNVTKAYSKPFMVLWGTYNTFLSL